MDRMHAHRAIEADLAPQAELKLLTGRRAAFEFLVPSTCDDEKALRRGDRGQSLFLTL
jgi:hypothetical protein